MEVSPPESPATSQITTQEIEAPVERDATIIVEAARIQPRASVTGSTTSFDARQIEYSGIRELADIDRLTPNLFQVDSSTRSFGDIFTLRGIGNTQFFSTPGVVLYVDDVPLFDNASFLTGLPDIESVTVHRGPQGTRFGRNAGAGVIEVRTRQPDNEFHFSAEGLWGDFDTQEYRASLSFPIVPDYLFFGFAGFYSNSDGFINNDFLEREYDQREGAGGRAILRWTPTPEWDVSLTFGLEGYDDGSQRIVPLDTTDPFTVSSDVDGETEIVRNYQALRISGEVPYGRLLAVTSRQEWEVNPSLIDLDLSPLPIATSTFEQELERWTQEIRLMSPEDWETFTYDLAFFGLWSDTDGLATRGIFGVDEPTEFNLEERNIAVSGRATWKPIDFFSIGAGLRFDHTRRTLDRRRFPIEFVPDPVFGPFGVFIPVEGTTAIEVRDAEEFTEWAPEFEVRVFPCETLSIFGRYSVGFKPGGFTAFADNPELAQFETERFDSFEVGVEGTAWDGRVQYAATGFYYDIENYQVERSVTPTEFLVFNAAEARAAGAEVQLVIEPVEGLRFEGGFGYTDISFEEYIDPITGESFIDNRAPFTPDVTWNVAAQYREPNTGLFARVEFVHIGETFFNERNDVAFAEPEHGILNVRAGIDRENFGIYFVGENLTDETYFTNRIPDINAGVVAQPRFLGVLAKIKF